MQQRAITSIPVILGQTASGKTSVGIELAKMIDGEIISVDSRKVYEGLPVGTATPDGTRAGGAYLVKGVNHYLMSFLPADQPYSAGDFSTDASRLIDEIRSRGKTPILVGGTGFYFKSLEQGLPPLPKADDEFREKWGKIIDKQGVDVAQRELERVDAEAARAITTKDRHKIIRALEVHHLTGVPFSQWKNQKHKTNSNTYIVMGLQYAKELLNKRIEERSKHMLKAGMIEETEALLKRGFAPDCHALSSFGYREAVQVARGSMPRTEFLAHLVKGTKAYAKRQQTWFRTQVRPAWFPCDESSKAEAIAVKMKAFCYTRAT